MSEMLARFPGEQEKTMQPTGLLRETPRDGIHVPTFYLGHPDPNVQVRLDGELLLPIRRVEDLPIERRWAVREDGEVRSREEYEQGLERIWRETYALRGRPVPRDHLFQAQPMQSRKEYVSMQVDPQDETRYCPIGYDANATRGAEPSQLFDAQGEKGEDRMTALLRAYASPVSRKLLQAKELELVEQFLGAPAAAEPGGAMVAKLQELNALRAAGDLTPAAHSRAVARLTGSEPASSEGMGEPGASAPPRKRPGGRRAPVQMACGRSMPFYEIREHRKTCETCRNAAAEKKGKKEG